MISELFLPELSLNSKLHDGEVMALNKIRIIILLAISISLLACSEHSIPFTPENLPKYELAYFPLKEEYIANYSFSYDYNQYYLGSVIDFKINGVFRLEVTDAQIKESTMEAFFKLACTFFVDSQYVYVDGDFNPDTTYSRRDFIISSGYDIMLKDGSLWYVDNAPSFERLNEGNTILMMAFPVASGGSINLKLFDYRGAYSGRSLHSDLAMTDNSGGVFHYRKVIKSVPNGSSDATIGKYKGVENFSILEEFRGDVSTFQNTLKIHFELIE